MSQEGSIYSGEDEPEKPVEVIHEPSIAESSEDPPMETWSSLVLSFEELQTNLKKALYNEGLYHPGLAETCPIKPLTISSSSVARHPYFSYPAIEDPGIMHALLKPEEITIYPDDGQELYISICEEMGLCPIKIFYKGLVGPKIDLKYYGVNPLAVCVMAKALKYNKAVKILDLTDNFLTVDAAYHIGDMLRSNTTLEELNLSNCRIGSDGLKAMLDNMIYNKSVEVLNLSGNDLGDVGMEYLATAFFKGIKVKRLDLRLNNITGAGAVHLAQAFEGQNKVTHWNLSWNKLCTPGTVILLKDLAETSEVVESIDLSWNSLAGSRIAQGIKNLLSLKTLQYLDLSNNKLQGEAIQIIASVLKSAVGLRYLDLSNNPLSPDDAYNVIKKLKLRKTKVTQVYMDHIVINTQCLRLLKTIKAKKPNLIVTYDRVIGDYEVMDPDFRSIVFARLDRVCKEAKKAKVDIAIFCLQLKRDRFQMLMPTAFATMLAASGVVVSEELLNGLAAAFPGPQTKEGTMIDVDLVVDYVRQLWPDKQLPPTPVEQPEPAPELKKKKKKKK